MAWCETALFYCSCYILFMLSTFFCSYLSFFSGLLQTPDPFLNPTTHGKDNFSVSYEISFLLPKNM